MSISTLVLFLYLWFNMEEDVERRGIDMVPTAELGNESRNIYIRYILKILIDTYMINQAKMAHKLGFAPQYFREYINGSRHRIKDQNLDKIEELIFDLYQPILEKELPEDMDGIKQLLKFI